MSKDRNKALRDTALLRNRLETCAKASPDPMTAREFSEFEGGLSQLPMVRQSSNF